MTNDAEQEKDWEYLSGQEAHNTAYKHRPGLNAFVSVLWLAVIINGIIGIWMLVKRDWEELLVNLIMVVLCFVLWWLLHRWALTHPHPKSIAEVSDTNGENGNQEAKIANS